MVYTCFFANCKANSIKNPERKFVKFVQPEYDLERCKRWIVLCRRSVTFDKIKKYTRVCSDHFDKNEVLDAKLNPTLDPIPKHRLVTVQRPPKSIEKRFFHKCFSIF